MTIRMAAAVGIGLLALLFSGCSSAPADPRASLEKNATIIDAAAQDVLSALTTAGLSGAEATGRLEQCGGSLNGWGAEYHASASAKVGDDLAATVEQVTTELTSLGWEHTGDLGGEFPTARLERDDVTVDVSTGGFTSGGTRYGADEIAVGIRPASACVKLPEGTFASDLTEFDRSIPPRE